MMSWECQIFLLDATTLSVWVHARKDTSCMNLDACGSDKIMICLAIGAFASLQWMLDGQYYTVISFSYMVV